jgi:hypothetical protein
VPLNACIGDGRHTYRVLVGRPKGKRPLGRHRCRWGDNMKMDLQEVGWGGMDWITLAQDRDRWLSLLDVVMSFQVP